jgi:hypothetical protein
LIIPKLRNWILSLEAEALSHALNCKDGTQKRYAKIKKRGQIEKETEYYFIRNVLNDPTAKTAEECELLEKMVSSYDAS